MTEDSGIIIKAYVGEIKIGAMGRRTIRLDVPESEAVPFMAALTLFGKFAELKIREVKDEE